MKFSVIFQIHFRPRKSNLQQHRTGQTSPEWRPLEESQVVITYHTCYDIHVLDDANFIN